MYTRRTSDLFFTQIAPNQKNNSLYGYVESEIFSLETHEFP